MRGKEQKRQRVGRTRPVQREDYNSLASEYLDANSLMYKKIRVVDSHIDVGEALLDIGMGTGELIELGKYKFKKIYGIDIAKESIDICRRRFQGERNITLIQGSIRELGNYFQSRQFDYITCLDILEHIDLKECEVALLVIANLLRDDGKFIFTRTLPTDGNE